MKKIIAFLMALVMTTTVFFNTYKAHAMAVPVSYLAYLIQAVTEMLVGSGTCTQSQISDMNTSQLFETAKGAAPSIDWEKNAKWKVEFIQSLNYFLNDAISKQIDFGKDLITSGGLSEMVANKFVEWTTNHSDDLKGEVDVSFLKGYSSSIAIPLGNGLYTRIYGKNGCFYINDSGGITVRIEKYYLFAESSGAEENNPDGITYSFTYDPTYSYYGEWTYADSGALADDKISDLPTVGDSDMGTITIDGVTYTVDKDGKVHIGDKTYTINDDGSVTVDDKTYYPDYDVTPYNYDSLIDLLLKLLNNIDVAEDSTAGDLTDDSDVEMSEELANSELSSLVLPKTILTVFPFCIPWDFYNGIKLLSQEPEAPRFEVPFEIPAYKSFPGLKKMIVIDFSEYSSAFAIVRWTFFVIFMFGLCFVTFKIVKGI